MSDILVNQLWRDRVTGRIWVVYDVGDRVTMGMAGHGPSASCSPESLRAHYEQVEWTVATLDPTLRVTGPTIPVRYSPARVRMDEHTSRHMGLPAGLYDVDELGYMHPVPFVPATPSTPWTEPAARIDACEPCRFAEPNEVKR